MNTSADPSQVAFPVIKAASAIAAGAGSSVLSTAMANPAHFLPTSYGEWAAAIASTSAAIYTLHLLGEWYWKKWLRGWCVRQGWIKAKK